MPGISFSRTGWRWAMATLVVLVGLMVLAGCAAGPNGPFTSSDPAGFLAGLWHGFIAWITFILSLFTSVEMYSAHNTGWPYNLGFLIGISAFAGGGGKCW